MKVSWFKVLGMIGLLSDELTKVAMDGKITPREAVQLTKRICDYLDLDWEEDGYEF